MILPYNGSKEEDEKESQVIKPEWLFDTEVNNKT
jgi:hypothetical protein